MSLPKAASPQLKPAWTENTLPLWIVTMSSKPDSGSLIETDETETSNAGASSSSGSDVDDEVAFCWASTTTTRLVVIIVIVITAAAVKRFMVRIIL